MEKYIISAIIDDEVMYYCGNHYMVSKQFARNIYHATLYSNAEEAALMFDRLGHALWSIALDIKRVYLRITFE